MTILPLKSNGHGIVWIAKMSQLKTIEDQDISTNVWMLASLVSLSSFNREADQLLSCNSVYEKTFMIPKWMQEMLKLRISKKRMNKGVATQKVITFSKRVVDLQPTHNRFLHFSSLCSSLRLFWGISVSLLVWFGLSSVHGLERNVQCIFQSRLHFPISAPVGMAWNSSFLILLASLYFYDFATAKNPCKTEVSVLGMALTKEPTQWPGWGSRLRYKPHQLGVQLTNRWDHCITSLKTEKSLKTTSIFQDNSI